MMEGLYYVYKVCGWLLSFRTTYIDKPNKTDCDTLLRKVKINNPSFSTADIRGKKALTRLNLSILLYLTLLQLLCIHITQVYVRMNHSNAKESTPREKFRGVIERELFGYEGISCI